MTEKEIIFSILRNKNVVFEEYEHAPIENVLQRFEKNLCFNAVACKNLFVTTRKHDRVFLVMLRAEKKADLKKIATLMQTTHLGFAPQEMLAQILNQEPGAVGPLGILRDKSHVVEVVFDESLRQEPRIAMHPSVNNATVVLSHTALQNVIEDNGNKVFFITI